MYTVGIVGVGKIAADQHQPVINKSRDFTLQAVVSRRGATLDGAPSFTDLDAMLAAFPNLDAVSICTPPVAHFDAVQAALRAGKHVLLEKPPTLTLSELAELEVIAAKTGVTLFTTWHSRFNAGVRHLRDFLADKVITSLAVTWKEDVRRWHPGQAWIWEPGGFGVFDPGINALSIMTELFPNRLALRDADLDVPSNRHMPIAARLVLSLGDNPSRFTADFDWRQTGQQTWDIDVTTQDGVHCQLRSGGCHLVVDGETVIDEPSEEYEAIYERFSDLIGRGMSEVDAAPLRLVADAFMIGRRHSVDPFVD